MPISKVAMIRKDYSGTTRIFQALTIIVLIAAGTWGFFQYQSLVATRSALAKGETEMITLQTSVDDSAQAYKDLGTKATADTSLITNAVRAVFPQEEGYTALTRVLDNYAVTANTVADPFFAGSLSFGNPLIDPKNEYATLPFTMSITASRNNFDKFLQYVETSGDLDSQVRLMAIKTVSLQLPDPTGAATTQTTGPEMLNLSFALDTYFQKPVGATANTQ